MIFWTTFIVSFAGGVFPLISADLFVAGAVPFTSGRGLLALIAIATLAQVAGKTLTFAAGTRALATSPYAITDKWSSRLGRFHGTVVFVSALSGLPPFFAVAFASGMLRTSIARFVVAATAGRFIHIAAIAAGSSILFGGVA